MGAEFRLDVRGERMVVSPGRAARPYDFRSDAGERRGRCPFCGGREDRTPPELDAIRPDGGEADGPGWRVRVVPNLYPAFPREPERENGAFGIHEVIIETPDHDRGLADLSADQAVDVFRMWARRLRAAREDERIAYGCLFKNHGAEAGASLEHAHSQLMAMPYVPQRIAAEVRAADELERRFRAAEARVADQILSGETVFAWAPPDSRFPYEAWLAPRRPGRFEDASADELAEAAEATQAILQGLRRFLDDPPYHLIVYTPPFHAEVEMRWRIELFPRLTRVAGFEWATGVFVNQVDPARAAERLRQETAE